MNAICDLENNRILQVPTWAYFQIYESPDRLQRSVKWMISLFIFLALIGCSKSEREFLKGAFAPAIYLNIPKSSASNSPSLVKESDLQTKAIDAGIALGVYTPTAAFYGNQMSVIGGATGTDSNPSGAILVREANCSLTQYGISYGTTGVYGTASSVVATLPNADAYLHQISGLTTTPGTFPKGCANRTLGVPSAPYAHLGKASDGNFVAVYVDDNGKMISLKVSSGGAVISQTTLINSGAAPTIAVADLNGDGIADIVSPFLAVGGGTGIGVFLSQANGTFSAPTLFATSASFVNRFLSRASIADINGDGKLDIVAVSGTNTFDSPTMVTLLGNGSGGFVGGTTVVKSIANTNFVLEDFNGDGKLDFLNAGGDWMPGLGDGSFGTSVQRFTDLQPFDGRNLAVADFNGDGKLDVMVRFGQITLTVYLGQGDGSFVAGASYATILGADYLTSTDVNGDGLADIVVGLSSASAFGPSGDSQSIIQFLLGKGDGSFIAAQSLPWVGRNPSLSGVPTFALADFNGDSFPDIVAQYPSGAATLGLYLGSNKGQFASPATAATLSFNPSMMVGADTDGDGKADLIAVGSSVVVLRGLGNSTAGATSFAAPKTFALPVNTVKLLTLAVGDINGDGRADVLLTMTGQTAANGGAFLYLANTDGSLKAPVQIDSAGGLGVIGDLNGDGRGDIVVVSTDGVRVYRGNADGSVAARLTFNTGITSYRALAVGDVNKDGKADLVVASVTSGLDDVITVLLGQGDGSFGPANTLALSGGGPGLTAIALGDFTFDGNVDLMLTGKYTQILIGQGNGTFVEASAVTLASRSTYVIAADLNRDTMMDAVVLGGDALVPLLRVPTAVATKAVVPPTANNEFALSLGSTSGTVSSGEAAQTSMTLNFGSAFTQAVTFSCSGLPAYATCSFSPASIAPGAGATTTTVTISTGISTTAALASAGAGVVLLGGLGGIGAIALGPRRRSFMTSKTSPSKAQHLTTIRVLIVCLLACSLLVVLTACGGGSGTGSAAAVPSVVTPAGTYPVTITASGGGVVKSMSYSLTVR